MFKKISLIAALAVVASLVPVASALAGTTITGVVRTQDGTRAGGAIVQLLRAAPGESLYNTRIQTTTDAYGRYTFAGLSNWRYYQVAAFWTLNYCSTIGKIGVWGWGYGAVLWATGGSRGSDISMPYKGQVSCY